MPEPRDIALALARRAAALVRELLPAGRRDGHEWRCGSLAGEQGHSLGVHLVGAKAGVWCDFASGEAGDALDLVAAVRFRNDKRAALAWARAWLGEDRATHVRGAAVPAACARDARAPVVDDTAERRRRAAQAIWLAAWPSLGGTPADCYLRGRGIDLSSLQRQPRALRCHPALLHRPSGRSFPALVAAVSDAAGNHVATHRTWLAPHPRSGVWQKAPVEPAKMSLGSVAGGMIRIWRGASGRPLADLTEPETTVLGEGIETCLSIAVACPELRVLCAVSLSNLGHVVLPAAIRDVIVAADNDAAPEARAALQRALERFMAEGRTVRIARAAWGKDFNDLLREAA